MSEYYQSRDVVIRFDVFKDGDPVTPISASVLTYDPDKEFLGKDTAKIEGNEVRYVLKGKRVEKVGKYTQIYKIAIRKLGDYTHVVVFTVKKLPVPIKGKE